MIALYMTSCEHRTAQQQNTIAEFTRHGFSEWRTVDYMNLRTVDVSTLLVVTQHCPMPPVQGNHKLSGVATMQHAHKYGADWLHVEDDILLADDFSVFLEMAKQVRDRVTYFYLHDFEPRVYEHYPRPTWERIKRGLPIRRVLLPVVQNKNLYGCQALFIPYEVLDTFLNDRRSHPTQKPFQFDGLLCSLTRELTKGALVALPHPVQHMANTTQFGSSILERKKSESFDVPRMEV